MNNLQIFENEQFGQVRLITIDNEPWFVGKDVADILGYSNSRKALGDHVESEDKGVTKYDTLGGMQDLVIINESGLYSLILSSKMPTAKQFKRWVTSEVLPSIRKTGKYAFGVVDKRKKLITDKTKEQFHYQKKYIDVLTNTINMLGKELAKNQKLKKAAMERYMDYCLTVPQYLQIIDLKLSTNEQINFSNKVKHYCYLNKILIPKTERERYHLSALEAVFFENYDSQLQPKAIYLPNQEQMKIIDNIFNRMFE